MPDMHHTQDKRRKGDEKQTERIEVRLGVTLRDQFLGACKRAGDTPSDILRAAMSDYVGKVELAERKTLRQELMMKLIHNPLKTATMALTSLAAFALVAAPSSADSYTFNTYDTNSDNVLSTEDGFPTADRLDALLACYDVDRNNDGRLSKSEFSAFRIIQTPNDLYALAGPEIEGFHDKPECGDRQPDRYPTAIVNGFNPRPHSQRHLRRFIKKLPSDAQSGIFIFPREVIERPLYKKATALGFKPSGKPGAVFTEMRAFLAGVESGQINPEQAD